MPRENLLMVAPMICPRRRASQRFSSLTGGVADCDVFFVILIGIHKKQVQKTPDILFWGEDLMNHFV